MEIIIAILSCALIFVLYLLNTSKREISQIKEKLFKQENELIELKQKVRKHENTLRRLSTDEAKLPPPDEKRFVQVIFNPDSKKCYDYLLGNNPDLKVGDFVEVYVSDKDGGKPAWSIAKVVYISEPGEKSEYAKSKIKRKSDYKRW